MRQLPIAALVLSMVLALVSSASALQATPASDQPIHVVSDRLEVDNKTQVASFIGAVKATQGDVSISCDKLEVYYDQEAQSPAKKGEGAEAAAGLVDSGGKVRKVVALGHVKIRQKDRLAVGRKATYWAGGRKMLLEGKATVWRGKSQISGDKITLFLDQDRAVVHGRPGKRVAVTIVPGGKKK